jgi:hypothetical protein
LRLLCVAVSVEEEEEYQMEVLQTSQLIVVDDDLQQLVRQETTELLTQLSSSHQDVSAPSQPFQPLAPSGAIKHDVEACVRHAQICIHEVMRHKELFMLNMCLLWRLYRQVNDASEQRATRWINQVVTELLVKQHPESLWIKGFMNENFSRCYHWMADLKLACAPEQSTIALARKFWKDAIHATSGSLFNKFKELNPSQQLIAEKIKDIPTRRQQLMRVFSKDISAKQLVATLRPALPAADGPSSAAGGGGSRRSQAQQPGGPALAFEPHDDSYEVAVSEPDEPVTSDHEDEVDTQYLRSGHSARAPLASADPSERNTNSFLALQAGDRDPTNTHAPSARSRRGSSAAAASGMRKELTGRVQKSLTAGRQLTSHTISVSSLRISEFVSRSSGGGLSQLPADFMDADDETYPRTSGGASRQQQQQQQQPQRPQQLLGPAPLAPAAGTLPSLSQFLAWQETCPFTSAQILSYVLSHPPSPATTRHMLDHIGQFKSALEGDSTNRVAFHGLGFVSLEARTCPLRVNTVARMLTEHRAFYRTLVLIFPPQWRVWLTMRLGPELLLNPQHYVRVQFDRSAAVVSHKTLTTRHADGETGRWDICAEQDLNKQCRQHISQQGFAQSVVASKLEAQGFHAQPAQPVMYAAPQMPSAASAATAEQVRDSLRAAERGAAGPEPLDG